MRGAPGSRTSTAVTILVLCVLAVAAYINSVHAPFVFDDGASVERNPGVRFGDYHLGSLFWTRSLLFASFALNHKFGGMDVWGYHAVNLVLHILNGILVFLIARIIFSKTGVSDPLSQWMAGLAAGLFLVHPLQTESVTYISSRSELLSTFFYALAVFLFVRWPERRIGFGLAIAISVLFVFGLGSKETVISLPAALIVYDFIFIAKGRVRPLLDRWRFYIVFLALGAAGGVYLIGQWRTFFRPDPRLISPTHYLLTQLRVMVQYIRLLFLPVGLNLDHDFRVSTSLFEPAVLLCLAILLTLIAAAFYWRRSRPILAFSIFWFFLTLTPTSSFFPIQDVIFEHRLYVPLVGVCLLFPVLLQRRILACAILGVFLIATVYRNYTWGDEIRLYSDIVEKSPGKARAYNALTLAYFKRGQVDQAIAAAKAGITNVPQADKSDLQTILGNLYLQTGRYDDAIDAYTKAVGGGDPALVYNNLGVAYLRSWQQLRANRSIMSETDFQAAGSTLLSRAESAFLESYHRDPSNITSLDSLVDIRHSQGTDAKWRPELIAALKDSESFEPLYSLGKLAWLEQNYDEANSYFERALRLRPDEKLLRYNYAFGLAQSNHLDRAIGEYLQAIRRDPTFWEAHYNVALLYMKSGEAQNAIEQFDEVLRLNPEHFPTLLNLARLLIERNEPLRARPYLQEALRINPQNSEARNLWQRLGS